MIQMAQGNLLEAPCEALVNTVNEVGVMGKGIALMFREAFPENTRAYQAACKAGEVRVGRMFVTENHDLLGPRWIINFPTKKHWRNPSRLEWVRDGLADLVRVIRERGIRSVAVPPLGCGNGRLPWADVWREIEQTLGELDGVEVLVYAPTDEYQNKPKRQGVKELTPARALVAEMVRRYAILGLECTNLEVQKLAWFLQRSTSFLRVEDLLRLHFVANKYGPYADELRHLLNGLDGSYLHCEKRLSDAGPLDLIWFENKRRRDVEEFMRSKRGVVYLPVLEKTSAIIDGFESPLGMELLATVDWLLYNDECAPDVAALREALRQWPGGPASGERKLRLFDGDMLKLAITRLAGDDSRPGQFGGGRTG